VDQLSTERVGTPTAGSEYDENIARVQEIYQDKIQGNQDRWTRQEYFEHPNILEFRILQASIN
jgi:hypothetical protein